MAISRRTFIGGTAAGLAFAGLAGYLTWRRYANPYASQVKGYGDLLKDARGILDLPRGFDYKILARVGEPLSDGSLSAGQPDGQAAFAAPGGRTILIRNHELDEAQTDVSAWPGERPSAELFYDAGEDKRANGGTSTLVLNAAGEVETSFMSLAGTHRNCAGGPTPWGTWLSCEETTETRADGWERDHGYVFEVAPRLEPGLTPPVRRPVLGRFRHEAAGVLRDKHIIYMTEDDENGLFYRFVPDDPADPFAGGRLQALAVRDAPGAALRNWNGDGPRARTGESLSAEWVDLDQADNPDNDLRSRGHSAGAAVFARGEGLWMGGEVLYFACTTGGPGRHGQIWRYRPGPFEGTEREAEFPGLLTLFVEPHDPALLDMCDNLTIAPWGDLIVCEDRDGYDHLRGISPDGYIYTIARNRDIISEMAGCCFSPDGQTLFLNLMDEGLTLAIRGPWAGRSLARLNPR